MVSQQDLRDAAQYLTPQEYQELQRLLRDIRVPQLGLTDFVRRAWPYVEPNIPYLHNWHIDVIADHLEAVTWGQIQNLIINIPPRYMKSTLIAVCWQPWVWSFREWSKWLFFSHSKTFATRDNAKSRRLINSPFYRELAPQVVLSEEQNTKARYENTQGGLRAALGVGGATGDGGDFLVGDDLLNIEDRHSKAMREAANEFWSTTVATRNNTERTGKVIICQRLHERDIVGHLKEKEQEGAEHYDVLVIPAEYEPHGKYPVTAVPWQDPREDDGDLLWPGRFGRDAVDSLKRSLGGDSSALLQQRPSPASGAIFKKYWWRFWYPPGNKMPPVRVSLPDGSTHDCPVMELPVDELRSHTQSWDTAFKDGDGSAFVVGQVWAKTRADRFLLDQTRRKMDTPATIAAVRSLSEAWPQAKRKLIEDKASGPAVMQTLRRELAGILAVNPKGDKVQRAHAVTPECEAGNVYLPHPQVAPWVWDLIDEAARFPNGEYADQVDAMTQALNYLANAGWSR